MMAALAHRELMAYAGMSHLHSAFAALGCKDVSYYNWPARFRPSDFRDLLWERLADRLGLGF